MLSREFTKRETILLIICVVLALGVFYYEVAYRNITAQIESYNTDSIQEELDVANARAAQIKQMEATIQENLGKYKGNVAVYNNLANEVEMMGRIMEGHADNVSLTWNDPTLTGTTVRRDVNISFHASDYTQMMNVLNALNACEYRCILKDVSVNASGNTEAAVGNGLGFATDVNVSLTVTFFETTEGAANTAGLITVEDETQEPGQLEERAKMYADN